MPVPLTSSTARSESAGRCCLLPFALVWTGFSIFWIIGAAASGAPWWFVLFGTPFVAIGFGMIAWVMKPVLLARKIDRAEVVVSSDALRLGEEFMFTFRQVVKAPIDVQRVLYQLVFRESATYQSGSSSTTVTHEVPYQEVERGARSYRSGEAIAEQLSFRIPRDGMHTFLAPRNKLQWFVKVKVEIARWPDAVDDFEIRVLPGWVKE